MFGLVPNPGFPAHTYVHPDGRVYEGTYDNPAGDSVPSRVFEYEAPADDHGTLVRSWTVQGQNLGGPHGVQVATSDRFGRLILLDKSPPRILALDRATGEQTTLAYFPAGAVPNYAAWDTDRNLYVTDYEGAIIWRLREGSNRVTAWLSGPVLDGLMFGTTGIVLSADHRSFVVSQQSEAGLGAGNPTTGRLLRIPITADGSAGPVSQIWESQPFDGPDGFAISASGAFYVTLLVTNQIAVIGPDGTERERFPPNPLTGANGSAVPFDNPSSARFLGTRLMVANQSYIMGDPTHMAILDVETDEAGLPEYVPPPPKAAKKAKAKKKKKKHKSKKKSKEEEEEEEEEEEAMSRPRAVLAGVLTALAVVATPAAAAPTLPLDHAGRWITDADGRVVILHGVNMVAKRPPYAPDATGFSEDDAVFLAAEGYNSVRVGIIYKAVEPQPGRYDDAYLERIEATVDMLARHGITSLLDFHQDLYNERFQGEGWPDWAVNDDGLPAQPQLGFPYNYLLMPALQRAFDHFWANDPAPGDSVGLQDRYAAAWRHVAGRFRDNPAVLGYDLMNEPWPGTVWQPCANPLGCPLFDATMSEFINRTIKAIREVDPTTLAFYEPNVIFNDGAATNVADTGDAHAGFSFHDYCLTHDALGSNLGCDVFDNLVFQNAESHIAETGDTSLLTEFGATTDPDVLGGMTSRADRFMVGWQMWHYCACDDPTTSGPGAEQAMIIDPRKPPEGANVDTAKLALLSRAYAQVVAGTPAQYAFVRDRFTLSYSTTRADGNGPLPAFSSTDIVMPARQYPNGYGVLVKGGTVLSAPGARVLRIGACPGAESVSVTAEGSRAFQVDCTAPPSAVASLTKLRVSVSPKTVRTGRRVTLRFTVKAGKGKLARAVKGATVTLAGTRARTNSKGRATIRRRFARAGKRTATVRAKGFASARATVRVRR